MVKLVSVQHIVDTRGPAQGQFSERLGVVVEVKRVDLVGFHFYRLCPRPWISQIIAKGIHVVVTDPEGRAAWDISFSEAEGQEDSSVRLYTCDVTAEASSNFASHAHTAARMLSFLFNVVFSQ